MPELPSHSLNALADRWAETPAHPTTALRLVGREPAISGNRNWNCIGAAARIVSCDGSHAEERVFPCATILAVLETVGGDLRVEIMDGPQKRSSARSTHVSLLPAGSRVRLHGPRVSQFREVAIQITRHPGSAGAAFDSDFIDFAPRTMIFDRDIQRVAELIGDDCLSGRPNDCLYGDCLSIVLFKALARLVGEGDRPVSQGGLAPWQLRRVVEFMEANLVRGARIEVLANLVDLSSSYLIRAFKVSTGMTPQQWIRSARIRCAQQLLIEGQRSLASVAQDSGFADQAHLTRVFGRIIGESPGAWRRARTSGSR